MQIYNLKIILNAIKSEYSLKKNNRSDASLIQNNILKLPNCLKPRALPLVVLAIDLLHWDNQDLIFCMTVLVRLRNDFECNLQRTDDLVRVGYSSYTLFHKKDKDNTKNVKKQQLNKCNLK